MGELHFLNPTVHLEKVTFNGAKFKLTLKILLFFGDFRVVFRGPGDEKKFEANVTQFFAMRIFLKNILWIFLLCIKIRLASFYGRPTPALRYMCLCTILTSVW